MSCSSIFKEPRWLGFQHDGYPPARFSQYQKIRAAKLIGASARSQAALLQSWLTFGLIEAVVDKHIPESSLVKKTENGRSVLSLAVLPEIVQDWIHRMVATTVMDELKAWSERVHTALTQAQSMLLNLLPTQVFASESAEADDMPATACLIARIGEALANAKGAFLAPIRQQGIPWSYWTEDLTNTYTKEMVARRWCPFTINYLIRTRSVTALGYASMVELHEEDKKHDTCSTGQCLANMVDVANYAPKHTALNCDCVHSVPSLVAVKSALSQNEVPVIAISENGRNASVNLTVLEACRAPYVAISHVWADGLGSSTEKGLPTCQLRRLKSLTSKLLPDGTFWMDALCIPESTDMRKRAIGLMAQTYRDAAAVLVLDKGLQLCSSTAPVEEKLLRVLVSGWMQRLWTLQEAVLAKNLVFLFADALIPLTELLPLPDEMHVSVLKNNLAIEIYRLSKKSTYFNKLSIGDIARSLRWRATSKPEDETLAIASLLGVDPSALVNLPADQRLMTLLLMTGKLPNNILFLPGPKMSVPGFRWAPVSLMAAHGGTSKGPQLSTWQSEATCTREGLMSEYIALVFLPSTFESSKIWHLQDSKRNKTFLVSDPDTSPGSSYRCSMLLLLGNSLPAHGNVVPCVAVFASPKLPNREGDGEFTVHCEYKRRLLIGHGPALDGHAEEAIPVTLTLSGRLKVCVS